ncbi:MAG: hypothetical protein DELT_03282 [Desulfovibrio sp.]
MAELQPFVHQLPELFFVALGEDADLRQVQAHNALVKAPFKLIIPVRVLPRGQEAAAAHGAEHVALIVLAHLLRGNIVRVQPLGGAFHRQLRDVIVFPALEAVVLVKDVDKLRERGGHVNALDVLDSLQPLAQDFLDDHRVFHEVFVVLVKVQEQRDKRRLPVGSHQRVDLVLDGLDPAAELRAQPLVRQLFNRLFRRIRPHDLPETRAEFIAAAAQVFSQMPHVDGLAAILAAGDGGDDLRHYRARDLEAFGAFNKLPVHHRPVIEHVSYVNQAAVKNGLQKIVRVVEMQDSLVVRLGNFFGKQNPAGKVLGDLPGDQVALRRRDNRVFVGIFFHNILVAVLNQAQDGIVRRVGLTHQCARIAVNDIGLGENEFFLVHQLLLDDILDILHQHPLAVLFFDAVDDRVDFPVRYFFAVFHFGVCLADCSRYFAPVILRATAVPFDYLHTDFLLLLFMPENIIS